MDFSTITAITIPEGEVTKVEQADGTVLWEQTSADIDYFRFTSANAFTVGHATKNVTRLEYSLDKSTWTVWNDASIVSVDAGGTLYIRGTGNTNGFQQDLYTPFWTLTGTAVKCSGYISTLINYSVTNPTIPNTAFGFMFYGQTSLTDISNLTVDYTIMPDSCFQGTFMNCTNLTSAIGFPAATIYCNASCFNAMFQGCTNLTVSPSITIGSLADSCMRSMFRDCTAMHTANIVVNVTDWPSYCFYQTFYHCPVQYFASDFYCTSISSYSCYQMFYNSNNSLGRGGIRLDATDLAEYCYYEMFRNSAKVPYKTVTINSMSNYSCAGMFRNASSSDLDFINYYSGTTAPYCFEYMYRQNYNIQNLPILNCTSFENQCCYGMFYGCTGIYLSETQDDTYTNQYRIPSSGTGQEFGTAFDYMFYGTSGSFIGTPLINTTYYTSNSVG